MGFASLRLIGVLMLPVVWSFLCAMVRFDFGGFIGVIASIVASLFCARRVIDDTDFKGAKRDICFFLLAVSLWVLSLGMILAGCAMAGNGPTFQ